MLALVDCEESQEVTKALRAEGHEAYSCDLQPCSGGHPEWHLQMDAIKALYLRKWDLVIAHPPCTRLANSGVRWLTSRKPRPGYEWSQEEQIYINSDESIWQDLKEAIIFFNHFVEYGKKGNKIRIENTIHHKYAKRFIEEQSQVVQPWHFGHKKMKATCFWNYNMPDLIPTKIVGPPPKDKEERRKWQNVWMASPGPDRGKIRSKTYPGIAKALATQTGENVRFIAGMTG